jgi:hypothetical protein
MSVGVIGERKMIFIDNFPPTSMTKVLLVEVYPKAV